jgi:hypothetical protein
MIWNIPQQKLVHDVCFPFVGFEAPARWLDGQFLLLKNSNLLDPSRRAIVWSYGAGLMSTWVGPWQWSLVETANRLTIVPVKLPHAAARTAAQAIDADLQLALRPGTPVSVDMTNVTNHEEVGLWKNVIEASGLRIAPDQRIRFVVKERVFGAREAGYHVGREGEFRMPFDRKDVTHKVQVTGERLLEVGVEIDGIEVWSWFSHIQAPWVLQHGILAGSLEADINRQIRDGKYDAPVIPLNLVDPAKLRPRRGSKITAVGLEDVDMTEGARRGGRR